MEGGTTSIWGLYEQLRCRPHYKAHNSILARQGGANIILKGWTWSWFGPYAQLQAVKNPSPRVHLHQNV